MKLTKNHLRKIIKEETSDKLNHLSTEITILRKKIRRLEEGQKVIDVGIKRSQYT